MFLEKGTLVVRTKNNRLGAVDINQTEYQVGYIFKTVKEGVNRAFYTKDAGIFYENYRLATDKEKAYFEAHPDTTNISEIPSDWDNDDIKVGDWVETVSLVKDDGEKLSGIIGHNFQIRKIEDGFYYATGNTNFLGSCLPIECIKKIPKLNETPFDKIQVGGTFINSQGNFTTVLEKSMTYITVESNLGTIWDIKSSQFNQGVNEGAYTNINFNNKKQKEDGKVNTKNNDKEGLLTSNTGRQRQGNVIISVGRRQSTTGCRPVGNSQRIKCRESTVIKTKRSSNIISF